MMSAGFDSVPKNIENERIRLSQGGWFQRKLAKKIYGSIQKQIKETKISKLMAVTNLFGRGMGPRRINVILKKYPDILVSKESDEEKRKKVATLDGFAETAAHFVDHIPEFIDFLKETELTSRLKELAPSSAEKTSPKKKHPLYEKRIVFTGFRDKELAQKLEAVGAVVSSSISGKTFWWSSIKTIHRKG